MRGPSALARKRAAALASGATLKPARPSMRCSLVVAHDRARLERVIQALGERRIRGLVQSLHAQERVVVRHG